MLLTENANKKVLFITSRLFWPADSGRKVSLYYYCKGLKEQLGYDVYVYSFLEGGQKADEANSRPEFLEDVRVASPISSLIKVKNLISAAFNKHMPLQCALYQSADNRAALRSFCATINPDVIIIDMIRFAPYIDALDDLGCPVVLDYDDLLSKRYLRQINEKGGNFLGNYAVQSPGIVGKLAANGVVGKVVLSIESARVREAEDWYARKSSAVLFVSPKEAQELDRRLDTNKCFSATVGAKIESLPQEPLAKKYDLGFVGNFNTSANQASLHYICNEILPLVPDLSFRVIGVCPKDIEESYRTLSQVSFSGRVKTISGELLKCKMMLCPFAYGSGIKTKVLEAMGMGLPVVTNSLGVEGLTCEPGVDLLVAETPQALASACEELLGDGGLRQSIGFAGQEYVRMNHDWKTSVNNLGRCLDYAMNVPNA